MNTLYARGLSLLVLLIVAIGMHAESVKGVVSDENNQPLPGASVTVDGTRLGTATDFDGRYTLELTPGTYTIKFGSLGYTDKKEEITVTAGNDVVLDVKLQPSAEILEDAVVVGYGVQRRRDVTGSIAKVDGKEITSIPVPSFEAGLQGRAAGVQVSQGSGLAGSGSIVRVRGLASISAGGDPLYVVDGIPITQDYFIRGNSGAMNNNPLASINPNDIASIEVLKDAAATGIYGSRGSNGVIIITTKRGKKKGLSVDFTSRVGISTPATLPNMLNTDQYLTLRQEAWENDGGTGYVWLPNLSAESDDPETRRDAFLRAQQTDTDWVDETVGIGIKHGYNVGLSKVADRYKVYLGLGHEDNGSYLIGNRYIRTSARLNGEYKFNDKLTVMLSSSFSRGNNDRVDAAWSGGLGDAMSNALPYYPVTYQDTVFDTNGEPLHLPGDYFIWRDEFGGDKNPVAFRQNRLWRTQEDRTINNLALVYQPIEDLFIKVSGSLDYMNFKNDFYNPGFLSTSSAVSSASRDLYSVLNFNSTATANYTYHLDEDSRLDFLVGTEYQRSEGVPGGTEVYQNVTGAPYQGDAIFTDSTTVIDPVVGNSDFWSFLSYFGRATYVMNDKFIFQGTARVDGSSRFGANKRYGFFPSASAGWILSEEHFLKDHRVINFLKLKASWGITGNANIPGNTRWALFSGENNGILYNQQPITFPIQRANEDLRWERSRSIDLSLEAGLWKDRVHFEVAYYDKHTTDVLMTVSTPASIGFGSWTDNVATILNRGIEFSITSRNIVKQKFSWTTNFNISRNYNELVNIGNYTPDAVSGGTNDSRVIVGSPIGSFFLVEFSHIDPENGLPVYLDLDGNETYDYDNAIRKSVGDGLPNVIGGINNTFTYGKWNLGVFATFSLGAKIFDSSGKRQMGVVTSWNMREEVLDRWRQPGDDATFGRLTLDETTYGLPSGFPWWNTSLFVYDADYLRIKNISLGYTFDAFKVGEKVSFQNLTLTGSVTNAFTLTNFPGLDPEVVRDFENPQDRNLSPNVTYLTPPQERAYTLTLTVNF